MRSAFFKFATILSFFLAYTTAASALDVYIIAGQSNGFRLSSIGEDPKGAGQHKVYYYHMKCVSEPEKPMFHLNNGLSQKSMGFGLADALQKLSNDDIIIVQYCRCGASIQDHSGKGWYPGDDPENGKFHNSGLYGKFLKYMAHAKKSAEEEHGLTWDVKGLFWHQGESDAKFPGEVYERNLSNLIWRFRKDIKADLPIVAAHIRALSDERKAINLALDNVAKDEPQMVVVPSNDLQFESPTNVHFATKGCHDLGRRMVEAFTKLKSP
ncbi:MAG: hypothetical protein ACI8XO_001666 [Verrucomicrobiales bacterium]|jgi:hypothetical protein